jgi:hypothetical protein
MNKKLYLTKTTLGLVNATKIINFEICGTEIIEFANETKSLYFEFPQKIGIDETIAKAAFDSLFKTNSKLCRVIEYEIYEKLDSGYRKYTGFKISLSKTNSDIFV